MKTNLGHWGLIVALVCGLLVAACSGTTHWKEEVQLSDGRIIVVERETQFEGGGGEWAHNRSLSKPKERRIRFQFVNKAGGIVEWRSTKEWRGWPEIPLIVDVYADQPIVITIGGEPCEQYFKYIYKNGVWSEETLPRKVEVQKTNLYLREDGETRFVSIAEKQKENSSVDYGKWLKQVGPDTRVCH